MQNRPTVGGVLSSGRITLNLRRHANNVLPLQRLRRVDRRKSRGAARCVVRVRARLPAAPGSDACLSVLERRHPAVIQTLRLLWGYPELNQYFEKVYSGRDSSLNLAPDAMAELMVLASVHQRICPHRPAATRPGDSMDRAACPIPGSRPGCAASNSITAASRVTSARKSDRQCGSFAACAVPDSERFLLRAALRRRPDARTLHRFRVSVDVADPAVDQ